MKSTRCLDRSLDRAANKLRENVLSARRAAPAGASLVELLRETIDSSFYDNSGTFNGSRAARERTSDLIMTPEIDGIGTVDHFQVALLRILM